MQTEIREAYITAGTIAGNARRLAASLTEQDTSFSNIAEQVETYIREQGAQPAFPVNISINSQAAHYTPLRQDTSTVAAEDVIKIDVGAHIDGYIADTAITINLNNNYEPLLTTATQALESAIQYCQPGITVQELSKQIHTTIHAAGYQPIRNLGGHSLERYVTHAGLFIPNIQTDTQQQLEEGMVVAIEPFATDGAGFVKEGKGGNIYLYEGGTVRGKMERQLLSTIKQNYGSLPFTSRWLPGSYNRMRLALSRLAQHNLVHHYPVLKEAGDGMVSQAEHTVLVEEKPVVITQ